MIAMLRYGLRPNDPGRPLEQIAGPFWMVPNSDWYACKIRRERDPDRISIECRLFADDSAGASP